MTVMTKIKTYGTTILLLLVLCAQAQTSDFGTWVNAGFTREQTKKIDISGSIEARMHENATRLDVAFGELSASYKLVKRIAVELAYRGIVSYDVADGYLPEHRFFIALAANMKKENFKITYKCRFQKKFTKTYKEGLGETDNTLRNKLSVKYLMRGTPYRPFVGFELFNPIEHNRLSFCNKLRSQLGLEYLITSKYSLSVFYLNQREFNVKNPQMLNVVGIGFEAEL